MPISKRKFAKEYLKVLQDSLSKDALAEILSGIATGEDVSGKLETALLDASTSTPTENEAVSAIEPYNPKEHDILDLVESLRHNVVRLVFYKVNGDRRVMFATRNPEIIELYDADSKDPRKKGNQSVSDIDSEDKIAQQIAADAIRVFDLEKNVFRAFKPSRLATFDNEDNVGSWIEFKPEYDTWYIVAKEGGDIHKYYRGGKEVLNRGKSKERKLYENQARQDLRDAQYTREQNIKREEELAKDPQYLEKVNADKLKLFYTGIQGRLREMLKDGAQFPVAYTNASIKIADSIIKITDVLSCSLVRHDKDIELYVINVNGDYIILNPYFIINTSYKQIYFDALNLFSKGIDKNMAGREHLNVILLTLAKTLESVKKDTKKLVKLNYTDKDARRAKRLMNIASTVSETAKDVKFTQDDFTLRMDMKANNIELSINPVLSTVKLITGKNQIVHVELARRDTPTAVLPMVDTTKARLTQVLNFYDMKPGNLMQYLEMVEHAYNLRKTKFNEIPIAE